MLAQFEIPKNGCCDRMVPDQPTVRCPFFSLDVAGGVWSCRCGLNGIFEVSLNRPLALHLDVDTYHDTRPPDCPFKMYPFSLELQAEPTGDDP